MYVYNPSNFSVNYATYAANAYNNTFTFGNGTYFVSHSAAQSSLYVNGRQFAFQGDSNVGQLIPGQDNVFRLGVGGYRWKEVNTYTINADNASISTNAYIKKITNDEMTIQNAGFKSKGSFSFEAATGQAFYISTGDGSGRAQFGVSSLDIWSSQKGWCQVRASAFSVTSTRDTKENFKAISDSEALNLLKIAALHFDYKKGDKNRSGFVAEDVEPFFPDVCSYDKGKLFGLDYSRFTPYIVKLLQMHQRQIDDQQATIQTHENCIKTLEDTIGTLVNKLV